MNPSIRTLKIFLVVTLLAAFGVGTGLYFVQNKELVAAAEKELTAITLLKTREITR